MSGSRLAEQQAEDGTHRRGHVIVKHWHSGGSVVGALCSCGWEGTVEEEGEHLHDASQAEDVPS